MHLLYSKLDYKDSTDNEQTTVWRIEARDMCVVWYGLEKRRCGCKWVALWDKSKVLRVNYNF